MSVNLPKFSCQEI